MGELTCRASVGLLIPLKMMLMGPLFMSTGSYFCQRELQPSIYAESQLECWLRACSYALASSTYVRGHTSMLPHYGYVGCAVLMQSSPVALATITTSPFLIEGM